MGTTIDLPQEISAKAFVLPEGQHAWRLADLGEALASITASGRAILGGEVWCVEEGKRMELFPETYELNAWNTTPQTAGETWIEYCRRTSIESIHEVDAFRQYPEFSSESAFFHVTSVDSFSPLLLVPRHKHDLERAEAAVSAGYPAVEPVLSELLEWIQDTNWPVAQVLIPFLATIGPPIIPHLHTIFDSDDDQWKNSIISTIMRESSEVTHSFRAELSRIAHSPNSREVEEDMPERALWILEIHGLE